MTATKKHCVYEVCDMEIHITLQYLMPYHHCNNTLGVTHLYLIEVIRPPPVPYRQFLVPCRTIISTVAQSLQL